MSANISRTQLALHRFGRVNDEPPGHELQYSDLLVWLSTLTLPISAVLEFHCCPTALWSDDRTQCVLNRAATALLGASDRGSSAVNDCWLDCVDLLDRERFLSAWQSLLSGAGKMVCSYRFIPRGTVSRIEIEETALRLPAGFAGKPAVLSRYQLREARDSRTCAPVRSLVHQIGNSLQSVRGEVDLLRLFGVLPQQSFDTIVQGIENIRELCARLDDADGVTPHAGNGQAGSGNSAGRRCAEEVRRGRT